MMCGHSKPALSTHLSEGLTKNLTFLMITEDQGFLNGLRAALPQAGTIEEQVALVEGADDLVGDVLEILRFLDEIQGVARDHELLAEGVVLHPIIVVAV